MDDRPEHDDQMCPTLERPCWHCHLESLTLGLPKDHPTRTYSKTPPRGSMNSYENGIPVDRRPGGTEMPYLRSDGEVMRVHEFANKSHRIEENRKRAQVGLPPQ